MLLLFLCFSCSSCLFLFFLDQHERSFLYLWQKRSDLDIGEYNNHINNVLEVYKVIVELVEQIGSPWEVSKRGRPQKFSPKEHAELCIFMMYFDYTYRELEGISQLLIGKAIDHSTIP